MSEQGWRDFLRDRRPGAGDDPSRPNQSGWPGRVVASGYGQEKAAGILTHRSDRRDKSGGYGEASGGSDARLLRAAYWRLTALPVPPGRSW